MKDYYNFNDFDTNKKLFESFYPDLKFEDYKYSTLWHCLVVIDNIDYNVNNTISFEGDYESIFLGPVG